MKPFNPGLPTALIATLSLLLLALPLHSLEPSADVATQSVYPASPADRSILQSAESGGPVLTDVASYLNDTAKERKRCTATTKKGTQCKRNAESGEDYCWQHKPLPSAQRCQATTRAGKQCSRKVQKDSKFCWQHAKKSG
jgi:hypothetical protein